MSQSSRAVYPNVADLYRCGPAITSLGLPAPNSVTGYQPGYFINCCRGTAKMGVQPGNRRVLVSVPKRYVAGADTRGRSEGWPYPWSQQVIHETSGLC
jgi:hypothetical protein